VLGQVEVAEKSNEIKAIPALLDMLTVKGSVVTIDAMGCQKEIAAKIIDREADYVLALKGNQGTLRAAVELLFADQKACNFKDVEPSRHESVEKEHGRIETRTTTAIGDIDRLRERYDWARLKSIVMVESVREIITPAGEPNRIESETRFNISSLAADAPRLAEAIRGHWAIENSHHWVLDMVFRDDECRIRTANAPANFATIEHMASNLLRRGNGRHSLRASRKLAAWNDDFLAGLIARG
jgi:predicted transposase YbfD/YdcC